MEEEIGVGEYIRDRAGNIAKVIKSNNDIFEIELNSGTRINQYIEFITKHSKNLIDLIEVGDIVEVLDYDWVRVFNIDDEDILESVIEDIQEGNWKLQGIMTKEVYEQNSYKVEGEE